LELLFQRSPVGPDWRPGRARASLAGIGLARITHDLHRSYPEAHLDRRGAVLGLVEAFEAVTVGTLAHGAT